MERYTKRLILALFTLVAFATLTSPASATTISQLRSELDSARHHLYAARARLATARSDYQIVLAAYQAQTGAAATDATVPASGGTTTTTDGAATTTDAPATTATGTVDAPAAGAAPVSALTGLSARATILVLADQALTQDDVGQLAATVATRRAIVRRWDTLADRLKIRLAIACWNRAGEWKPLIGIAAARYHVSADGLYRLMQYESGGNRYAGGTYKGLFQYYPGTWRGAWNPWRDQSIYDGWSQIRATASAIGRGMGPSQWPNTYWRAF